MHSSVQGNHIHFIVEAADALALGRAMKGLAIRLARGLNRMMSARGQVFPDRFHARVLRTPTEVRHAVHYLRNNHQHHHGGPARVDPYTSDVSLAGVLPAPTLWALRVDPG